MLVTKYQYNFFFLILPGGWGNLHRWLATRENSELTIYALYSSVWKREREEWISQLLLGFQFFNCYDDSDTNETIGLSHLGLNFESTNWIFGNKIWIYQLLTKHLAKKWLVITEHHSFDTDLHRVADFLSSWCSISNTRSIGRSSMVVLTIFRNLWIVLTSEFLYEITLLFVLLLLLWCFFFTFLISIVKLKDFSFSYACFTKIKRILKITIFFNRLSSSYLLM